MSLRQRLLASLGLSFVALWLLVAGLMYLHLEQQVSRTLDQRLAASATMVAGLIARQPERLLASPPSPLLVTPQLEGVACQIRAENGNIILQTSGVDSSLLTRPELGFSTRQVGDSSWRLYTLRQHNHLITTADRMTERDNLARSIILVMVVPFALALVGGLLVLWWGIQRGLKPLQELDTELNRRQPSNLEPVTLHQPPVELAPIVGTLNNLFARVRRAVAWEQRFASNAAHEFRTPLTGIKTHLEVARRVTGDRQQHALEQAGIGVARLQRVTDQLLMLARLEQGRDLEQEQSSATTTTIAEALEGLAGRECVEVQGANADYQVAAPATLLAVALRNLLENALKYSEPESPVLLSIERTATTTPAQIRFLVRDQGWTTGASSEPPSPANETGGHGLGLAIVETIASQFHGTLTASRNRWGGMDWVLLLPASIAG